MKGEAEFEKTGGLNLEDIHAEFEDITKNPLDIDDDGMAVSLRTENVAQNRRKTLQIGGKTPR